MTEPDELIASSTSATLHWILRVAVAACFIGHGAFGVITKAAWLPYFAIFGIPEAWAWKLMPVVGAVDISVGVLTLIQPVRAVILYMTFWGFQTAWLRPIAGQGMWELLERAGNYGVPLAFLCLLGAGRSLRDWFSARPAPTLTVARASAIGWTLRVTTALLLIGHGGFDFAMHKNWTDYGAAVGISPAAVRTFIFALSGALAGLVAVTRSMTSRATRRTWTGHGGRASSRATTRSARVLPTTRIPSRRR